MLFARRDWRKKDSQKNVGCFGRAETDPRSWDQAQGHRARAGGAEGLLSHLTAPHGRKMGSFDDQNPTSTVSFYLNGSRIDLVSLIARPRSLRSQLTFWELHRTATRSTQMLHCSTSSAPKARSVLPLPLASRTRPAQPTHARPAPTGLHGNEARLWRRRLWSLHCRPPIPPPHHPSDPVRPLLPPAIAALPDRDDVLIARLLSRADIWP